MEIWKDIDQSNGRYLVSNTGLIKNNLTGKFIKGSYNNDGYLVVGLRFIEGVRLFMSVHRVVAKHFVSNPDNKPEVNHKDLDKANNHYSNLEWMTHKENGQHYVNHMRVNNIPFKCGPKKQVSQSNPSTQIINA